MCSYEADCEDIVDLRTEGGRRRRGVALPDMACAWFAIASAGREPPSWATARRLSAGGAAGVLVPSFAPSATANHQNLVLWTWGPDAPHRVVVHDPTDRLPKNQWSWLA
jgi:RES domain-containing protein